jgi:hypothetical protein
MFANAEICNFDEKNEFKLEPRLHEYLKKKKFYKENSIENQDNILEKEFDINKNDIIKIKNFLHGKKIQKNNYHSDMIKPKIQQFASELQTDNRLLKIKKKQQRDKNAIEQKNNYDIMSHKYDMYRNDRKFASAYGNDFKSRFNPQVWVNTNEEDSDGSNFEKSNPNLLNQNYNNEQIRNVKKRYLNKNNCRNKPPSIRYKDYMTRGCNEDLCDNNYSLNSIIGKLDTYRENVSHLSHHKRDNENNYRSIPLMNGSKQKDINVENYLCYGNGPSRGAKSLGYPNPAEHYFQYISDDISKPEHSVFEPGMPTRMYNKDTARPYKTRDIM